MTVPLGGNIKTLAQPDSPRVVRFVCEESRNLSVSKHMGDTLYETVCRRSRPASGTVSRMVSLLDRLSGMGVAAAMHSRQLTAFFNSATSRF